MLSATAGTAAADRYEATIAIRPVAGLGRFAEDGAGDASTYGGGGTLGLAYGLRNWLDVNAELVGAAFTEASYDGAVVMVQGTPTTGSLRRTTRLTQLRVGATLRLGTTWVPTLHLGMGLSARMPTAAVLTSREQNGVREFTPDGMKQEVQLDVALVARIGFERRFDESWSVGLALEVAHTTGIGGPASDVVTLGVSGSYTWYPLWW